MWNRVVRSNVPPLFHFNVPDLQVAKTDSCVAGQWVSVPPATTDRMNEYLMALYHAMPKDYGVVHACVKIGQHESKDGNRKYQTLSDSMDDDWWTKDMTHAVEAFAECFRVCPHRTTFGDCITFDDEMEEMEGVVLDVELLVTVTKITNWVFLVDVVNSKRVAQAEEVEVEEENPQ